MVLAAIAVLVVSTAMACAQEKPPATAAPTGPSTGTLNGIVTNTLNKAPVAGVALAFVPAVTAKPVTDASGAFTADLPTGV